ncbi:Ctr-domain-containing protein [Coniochaeta sp. PMI_546]|nr:Ctr-domain-containing protein [Coniochaeta sp. PMI_546]
MDHSTMDMSPTATSSIAPATTSQTMDMGGMGGSSSCKISMLWNWYTIDSCFIASSWHVTSSGMFAGSCIGVILLTMSLEFLRRSVKEYDRYLIRSHVVARETKTEASPVPAATGFRPNIFQQAIRAFLHMVQFAVAYFIMLLAMYYNGYIIICIFIGAYLGSFVFHWETIGGSHDLQTSASREATVCCG